MTSVRVARRLRALSLAVLTVTALSVSPAAAQDQEVEAQSPRIVGGSPATAGQFPWQVFLAAGDGQCGGSLISATAVLTAAHCVDGTTTPAQVTAYAGSLQAEQGTSRGVSQIVIHPGWNPNAGEGNDIAVLVLSSAMPLSSTIQTIAPIGPGQDALWAPGSPATVSGWGATSEGGEASDNLLFANVNILADSGCSAYGAQFDPNTMLCAGVPAGGTDACQGDSGGPLIVRNTTTNTAYQVGVVSFGEGCARPNFPGVYTKVFAYQSFLAPYVSTGPTPSPGGTPGPGTAPVFASGPCGGAVNAPALGFRETTVSVSASASAGQVVALSATALPAFGSFSSNPGNPATGTVALDPNLLDFLFGWFSDNTTTIVAESSGLQTMCSIEVNVTLLRS